MNKKIVLLSIIAIVIVAAGGLSLYFYTQKNMPQEPVTTQPAPQSTAPADTNSAPSKPTTSGGLQKVEASGTTPAQGTFTICRDQCGDGICQNTDPKCEEGDINCVCLESHAECPQDCK